MRMMLKVSIPVEPGNAAIKNEVLSQTVMGFVDRVKPEAAYFIAAEGKRTALFFFDMSESQDIPSIAEPFFMNLHAHLELTPAMNLDEMQQGVQKAMQ